MATKKEKQLAIAILKERLEHQTGKKVILKEDRNPYTFSDVVDEIDRTELPINFPEYSEFDLYKNGADNDPLEYFDVTPKEDEFILKMNDGNDYLITRNGYDYCRYVERIKKSSDNNQVLEEKTTGLIISDKDWQRMLDLVLSGDDGSKVAALINNKDKAIARFIAGLKLAGETPRASDTKKYYYGKFSKIGDKALELGATADEIQAIFDQTTVPQAYLDKQKDLGTKKISTYAGPISKAVLKAGYDIEFIKTNGNALTQVGKDAMSRNGRKWTIGYKTIIDLGNGKKINFDFDAITDEGGGTTYYSHPEFGWKEYGIREFLEKLLRYLKEEQNK